MLTKHGRIDGITGCEAREQYAVRTINTTYMVRVAGGIVSVDGMGWIMGSLKVRVWHEVCLTVIMQNGDIDGGGGQ